MCGVVCGGVGCGVWGVGCGVWGVGCVVCGVCCVLCVVCCLCVVWCGVCCGGLISSLACDDSVRSPKTLTSVALQEIVRLVK